MAKSIYNSPRLANSYAYHRPPVHQSILARIRQQLQITESLSRALDVGCGAGLSTKALESLAELVVGIEPERMMLAQSKTVSPNSVFLASRAEQLPFAARSFDLITAAGSINYADLDCFLPEAERALSAQGVLVIYDFSAGSRCADSRLERWLATFRERYPSPPGYELDVKALAYNRYGMQLSNYEELEVALPMTLDSYLSYVLSETGVEQAILRDVPEAEIGDWCQRGLSEVFDDAPREILFDAYIAYITRDERC